MTPLLPPFCMTFCLSSELSVMHVMLSFFATGVDIKVFVLPAQGQGLPILKLVPYFTFCKCKFLPPPPLPIKKSTNLLNVNPCVKKQVPLTHSRTALQDTGCAVSSGALKHFTFCMLPRWV